MNSVFVYTAILFTLTGCARFKFNFNDELTVFVSAGPNVILGDDAIFEITISGASMFDPFMPISSSGFVVSGPCNVSPCTVRIQGASQGELTLSVPQGMVVSSFGTSNPTPRTASLAVNILGIHEPGLNSFCSANIISKTGCGGQTSILLPSGNLYRLIEIGGMCWFAQNLKEIPSLFDPSPEWVNSSNNGWHGFFNDAPDEFSFEEGRMYNFAALMNDVNCLGLLPSCHTERVQGVCPVGFHVPSDCEWMALENALGMSSAQQVATFYRVSGNVGTQIKQGGSSGFEILPVGVRIENGVFDTDETAYHTSTNTLGTDNVTSRRVRASSTGVRRIIAAANSHAYRARCLKD